MDTNGWKIIHGLSNKQGVECANIPIEGEKIGWGKVKGMGMIGWWGKVVSQ